MATRTQMLETLFPDASARDLKKFAVSVPKATIARAYAKARKAKHSNDSESAPVRAKGKKASRKHAKGKNARKHAKVKAANRSLAEDIRACTTLAKQKATAIKGGKPAWAKRGSFCDTDFLCRKARGDA